jgi:hypothetical protein
MTIAPKITLGPVPAVSLRMTCSDSRLPLSFLFFVFRLWISLVEKVSQKSRLSSNFESLTGNHKFPNISQIIVFAKIVRGGRVRCCVWRNYAQTRVTLISSLV